jgi:Ca-activated chloride channel family protein
MTRWLPVLVAGLLWAVVAQPVQANGLLIPSDSSVAPLALVNHSVKVKLVEQVAATEVTEVFRNHTDRPLEATYIFPVPSGSSVNRFSMWIDGKEVKGEMVEADKARQIYTDIVRRMQDPGLLEYMGQNLLKVRVFPVPAHADQKLKLSFTSVCAFDNGLVEYTYPLKTEGKAAQTLEKFTFDATLTSQRKVHNVYSPTHALKVTPKGDHQTHITFEAEKATLDKDLKLYFSLGKGDVGLTALTYHAEGAKEGHFLFLISPRAELSKTQHVARDVVFVLDISGSMAGAKMDQAKKALKHCLNNLHQHDRFAVLTFSTTVTHQHDGLQIASKDHLAEAKRWVDELEATGGTAIDDALSESLAMRNTAGSRPFTIVFFTDGQPTVGEQDPEKIVKHVAEKNSAGTRIFTFGVGDDVNAALLDRLAEMTRSASAYVRPEEDIEAKVSSLYGKISHPVMTELKLSVSAGVQLKEMFPKELPDLFHGGQLVVVGKYTGKGPEALILTGKVDGESREMVYDVDFSSKTSNEKSFVEALWARRKVGYLLDQIRVNGQQKELVDEVVKLAKKFGITTPYSSYLVVPDTVASNIPAPSGPPPGLTLGQPALGSYQNHGYTIVPQSTGLGGATNMNTTTITNSTAPASPGRINYAPVTRAPAMQWAAPPGATAPAPTADAMPVTESAPTGSPSNVLRIFERSGAARDETTATPAPKEPLPQTGKEGVELALQLESLRNGERPQGTKTCQAAGKTCYEFSGAWIDDSFKHGMKTVTIKAQGEAYFKLLAKHPELKDVLRLGNRLVWVTPSGTALIVDSGNGQDKLSDAEMDALFAVKK